MPIKIPTLSDLTSNLNVPGGGVLANKVNGDTITGLVPGLTNLSQTQAAGDKPILGPLSKLEIDKYKSEAKEKNRESWWLAYVMDVNEEEKAKGGADHGRDGV